MTNQEPQNPGGPINKHGQTQNPYASTGAATPQNTQLDGDTKASQVKEQVGQAADQARERAGAMADSATQTVDEHRGQASDAMDTAAGQLRERGESLPGGDRTTEIASMAADKLEATSNYVREHDVQDMMSDLESLVRKHPTQSLITAAAAGFLVGRMLRS